MTANITPLQLNFLRLLGRSGFATTKHLEYMQIGKNPTKNSQSHLTKSLLHGLYMGRISVKSAYGIGQKTMYYLTKKGAGLLVDIDGVDLSEIAYTPHRGGVQKAQDGGEVSIVRADFPHKEKYISAFLALDRYLENTDYTITKAFHYYQLSGDRGTQLELEGRNFRPDGIFFCEAITPQKPVYAYIIEIHRHSSRKKIIQQLRDHVNAYKSGSMSARFGIEHPYFVLSVFTAENTAIMRSVIEELQTERETWAYMQKFFMFAELEELMKDFYGAFGYFGGAKKPLPPKFTS